MLRFHLYSAKLGSYTATNPDPIGINDVVQIFKRSEKYEGVMYEVIFDAEFIKGGRAFVKQAYETDGGIDAIVHVSIYERNPNTRRWELAATGKINFNKYELDEEKVVVNIEQTGIDIKILNLMETDVNLEQSVSENGGTLPAPVLYTPTFHSKVVVKQNDNGPASDVEGVIPNYIIMTFPKGGTRDRKHGTVALVQIDNGAAKYSELTTQNTSTHAAETFPNQPLGQPAYGDLINANASGTITQYESFLRDDEDRMNFRNPRLTADEAGILEVDIRYSLKFTIEAVNLGGDVDVLGSGCLGNVEVIAWFEHRRQDDTIVTLEQFGSWTFDRLPNNIAMSEFETKAYNKINVDCQVGDKFYVYLTSRVYGEYEAPAGGLFSQDGTVNHTLKVDVNMQSTWERFKSATFSDTSQHQTMFLYDAIKKCCQYYTNVEDCFHSDLLGRTELGYAVDGEGALVGITSGNKLRVNGKDLIANLNDLLEFCNAVWCIGFGFETIDGIRKFRVEKREHFYNKDSRILSLGKVYDIKKKLDPKRYWNQIQYGYNYKLDIQQLQAIDEFNTVRRSTIPITNSKNKLDVSTRMRASGNEIEFQRRLQGTTEESKLDDENFAVCLVRDGNGYKTQAMEGFETVTNVTYSQTGYNYKISPARCLMSWSKHIASTLIRSADKVVKFSYGEINYQLKTKMVGETQEISENGSLSLIGIEPDYDPEIYSFACKLTREQAKLIKQNPYGYIEFEDLLGNVMQGFICEGGIEYDATKGTAEFQLLKVHRPLKLPFTAISGYAGQRDLGKFKDLLIPNNLIPGIEGLIITR